MSQPIIALVGPKGCGKTLLANLLVDGRKYVNVPFAAPLKLMMKALLEYQGVNPHVIKAMLYGHAKESPSTYLAGQSARRAMQTLGTEWRDTIHRDLWTQIWRGKVATLKCAPGIVVDDLRFKHEANAIHAMGGKIFLINRPDQRHIFDPHTSEHEWKDILPDGVLSNREGKSFDMLDQLAKDYGILFHERCNKPATAVSGGEAE
jgi:hypothetical protein